MRKTRNSYQLHIQLCDTKPAVWRRLVVVDTMTLADLHRAIQAVMGWQNFHPYTFEIADQHYGIPNPDVPEERTVDARRYTLGQLLQGQGLSVRYVYGAQRGWQHRIKLEEVQPIGSPAALHSLPMCVGGRNACPPEICTGPSGFAVFMQAMQDPAHARHAEARELHPEDFDPTQFDLQRAQARLHSLALLRTTSSGLAMPTATPAA